MTQFSRGVGESLNCGDSFRVAIYKVADDFTLYSTSSQLVIVTSLAAARTRTHLDVPNIASHLYHFPSLSPPVPHDRR
jgi:hypothetical protein